MSERKNDILQLFREIQLGNKVAFDQLFSLYHHKLLFFARQYTKQLESAEELTSELFVKIWLKRETLSTVLHPEVYLYTCIKNACLNLIRSDKRRLLIVVEPIEQVAEERMGDHGLLLEDKELVHLLNLIVEALPEQRRIIYRLVKEQGLRNQVVADILGLSVRTVENQLYKAIKTLADALSVYLGYHPQTKIVRKQVLSNQSLLFFL